MFRKLIKKIFSLFGVQISRAVPVQSKAPEGLTQLTWIRDYGIKTIIDIGANEGQFANKILKVFPEAIIHCFEPLPDVFQQLQLNFQGMPNVHLHNLGLGETDEEKPIFNNEYSPSSSLLEMSDLHKTSFDFAVKVESKKIKVKRLDHVLNSKLLSPLLVKIDVQGYEMYVLRGGESVIDQADVIIIEASFYPLYKDQPVFNDIYQYFISRNFSYMGSIEQLLSPLDNKMLQADAVFIRNGRVKS